MAIEITGTPEQIDQFITYAQNLIAQNPRLYRPREALALVLEQRWRNNGSIEDLDAAIATRKQSLPFCPEENIPDHFDELGRCHQTRFEKTDSIGHLNDAIITAQDAFLVLPNGDSRKNMFLYHFVRALRLRFERLGDIEDLDAADLMMEEIIDTTPETDPQYDLFLNSVGNSLHARVSEKGDTTVINQLV